MYGMDGGDGSIYVRFRESDHRNRGQFGAFNDKTVSIVCFERHQLLKYYDDYGRVRAPRNRRFICSNRVVIEYLCVCVLRLSPSTNARTHALQLQ